MSDGTRRKSVFKTTFGFGRSRKDAATCDTRRRVAPEQTSSMDTQPSLTAIPSSRTPSTADSTSSSCSMADVWPAPQSHQQQQQQQHPVAPMDRQQQGAERCTAPLLRRMPHAWSQTPVPQHLPALILRQHRYAHLKDAFSLSRLLQRRWLCCAWTQPRACGSASCTD